MGTIFLSQGLNIIINTEGSEISTPLTCVHAWLVITKCIILQSSEISDIHAYIVKGSGHVKPPAVMRITTKSKCILNVRISNTFAKR